MAGPASVKPKAPPLFTIKVVAGQPRVLLASIGRAIENGDLADARPLTNALHPGGSSEPKHVRRPVTLQLEAAGMRPPNQCNSVATPANPSTSEFRQSPSPHFRLPLVVLILLLAPQAAAENLNPAVAAPGASLASRVAAPLTRQPSRVPGAGGRA